MKIRTKILQVLGSSVVLMVASCANTSVDPHAGHQMTGTASVTPYQKNVCLVTDNKLGSMGDPVSIIHEGQEVKFCCKPCIAKFKANPDKYLAKL